MESSIPTKYSHKKMSYGKGKLLRSVFKLPIVDVDRGAMGGREAAGGAWTALPVGLYR